MGRPAHGADRAVLQRDHRPRRRDRAATLDLPDRTPRSLGHGRARPARAGRPRHSGPGPDPCLGPVDQDRQPLRARPAHRSADPPGDRTSGPRRRRPRRPCLAHPAVLRRQPDASGADQRGRYVGCDHLRPARLPHRLPAAALRGAFHAAFTAGHAGLPGQFRGDGLGRDGDRPSPAGGVRTPQLHGLRGPAGPAPTGLPARRALRRHATGRPRARSVGRVGPWRLTGARLQPERRGAVRGGAESLPLAPRAALPGAALGLCRGCRPGERQARLARA